MRWVTESQSSRKRQRAVPLLIPEAMGKVARHTGNLCMQTIAGERDEMIAPLKSTLIISKLCLKISTGTCR